MEIENRCSSYRPLIDWDYTHTVGSLVISFSIELVSRSISISISFLSISENTDI
jgi:hypothetical protein